MENYNIYDLKRFYWRIPNVHVDYNIFIDVIRSRASQGKQRVKVTNKSYSVETFFYNFFSNKRII